MDAIRSAAVIGGKYRLESLLGQGGMGSIWVARHLSLDTLLAIKFITPGALDPSDARRRFEREAKAAALLRSQHVVQIHDYGVEGEHPYIVMELLQGEDLSVRLARRGQLTLEETGDIVVQVGKALRCAAEAGVVHRDLKPGNVFLVRVDDDKELVKVLDFGAAKAPRLSTLDDTTKAGVLIGSPRYMSPEQARASRAVDHRSDLWSLAIIAYRALTGRVPFMGEDICDLVLAICTEPALPPSCLVPELGPRIDTFFARALARKPDQRFQTAREMANAFAEAAGLAPPPSSHGMARHRIDEMMASPPACCIDPTPRLGAPSSFDTDPTRPSMPVRDALDTTVEQHSESTPSGMLLDHASSDSPPWIEALLRRPSRWWRGAAGALFALLLGGAAWTWRAIHSAPERVKEAPAAVSSACLVPEEPPGSHPAVTALSASVPALPPDAGAPATTAEPARSLAPRRAAPGGKPPILGN